MNELSARLDSLAANASAFMSSLQRTIDLQEIDEEAFLVYKDRLIAYLDHFVSELVMKAYDIRTKLLALEPATVERLLVCAAEREAIDAAPGSNDATEQSARDAKLTAWRGRWSGLRAWFLDEGVRQSQATLLRQRARRAIPDLLATVSLLQERRTGRSDRSADFRTLARWFAEAPSDRDAHRLWRAAFGLSPSRHLARESESDPVASTTSWRDAPSVVVTPRLRATGHYQRRGRQNRVTDRSQACALLAAQVARERAQTEMARRRLATGHTERLSEFGKLDRDAFDLFLKLLGDSLAAGPPDATGEIVTRTADGALEVRLRPLGTGAVAEIETPDGILRGPDHEITICDLSAPVAQARASTWRREAP